MPRNILIIGNGFDLYHKLPTRYSDFMFFASEWDTFYQTYLLNCDKTGDQMQIRVPLTDRGELTQEALAEFGKHSYLMDKKHIDFLNHHLRSNTWIQCFHQRTDQGLLWIDFEAEIQKVLYDVEEYSMVSIPRNVGKTSIEGLPDRLSRIGTIFGDAARNGYLNFSEVEVLEDYADKEKLQENKERLIEFMLDELNNLIKCLEYYLADFVSIIKCDYQSEQIRQLGDVDILNFNYTTTYQTIYRGTNVHEHHAVHGGITNGDIVLGIADEAFPDTHDYIRFQKYFQRIQKRTGSYYRDWLKEYEQDGLGGFFTKQVFIFGHSLGLADFGVLRIMFEHKGIEKIIIFHHDQSSYENLVINLVKAFDREKVVEMIGNGKVEFIQLDPPVAKEK